MKRSPLDVAVGVCTKNCAATVVEVMRTVDRGLAEFFPDKQSLIVVSDGFSTDGTLKRASQVETQVETLVTAQQGGPGKGNGVRTILEVAGERGAGAVALVDGDLTSIKPEWIKLLLQPILEGKDLVVPFYIRHRYDGVITNQLAFPLVSTLFGERIRQPIGGEYGLSAGLMKRLLAHPLYPADFGIDIFITAVGICEGTRIVEAALGVKEHESTKQYADPEELLIPMFYQVVGMLFELIRYYRDYVKQVKGIRNIEQSGNPPPLRSAELTVDKPALLERFKQGYEVVRENGGFLGEMGDDLARIALLELGDFSFPLKLWVQAVYRTINEINDRHSSERALDVLRVLWQGRFLALVKETEKMSDDQAERYIQSQLELFAAYEYMLRT